MKHPSNRLTKLSNEASKLGDFRLTLSQNPINMNCTLPPQLATETQRWSPSMSYMEVVEKEREWNEARTRVGAYMWWSVGAVTKKGWGGGGYLLRWVFHHESVTIHGVSMT